MDNNNENLICPVCETSNEADYKFCKNCGSRLNSSEPQFGGAQYTPPPNFRGYGYNSPHGTYYNYNATPYTDYSAVEPTLDGVDTIKVQAYVGNAKQDYFMQLFIAMKRLGRKLFVSWPVAIMGTLLATPFAAAWFFYRKMYRIGTIICLCCLLLSCVSTALTYSTTAETLEEVVSATENMNVQELNDYLMTRASAESTYNQVSLITYIIQLISLGGVLYLALHGNYFYFKHTTNKIKKLDSNGENHDLFFYHLQGRPSSAAAVIIPFIISALCTAVSFVPYMEIAMSGIPLDKLITLLSIV